MIKRILIVVAHPDDESFFYGGRMLDNPSNDYSVIVVTDGQGDGNPEERQARLRHAAELFGVKILSVGSQKDIEEKRLNVRDIMTILKMYQRDFDEVWTHSPIGDYQRHKHHQDTAIACTLVFQDKVRYNHIGLLGKGDCYRLSHAVYKKKLEALHQCYPDETLSNETAFQFFSNERMTALQNIENAFLLYAWFAESGVEKIVQEDPRFLDIWQVKASNHENKKVDTCVKLLSNQFNIKEERGLILGDNTGIYSNKLINSGVVQKMDGIEPFEKYQETIEQYGIWYKSIQDLSDNRYGLLVFVEVAKWYSSEEIYFLIDISDPLYILWSEKNVTSEKIFSIYEPLRKYRIISKTEIGSEFEYDLHKYFLFKRSGISVFLFRKCTA